MTESLLVLNAGSSSIKFAAFARQPEPRLLLRGQVEGLHASARFAASDELGRPIETHGWDPVEQVDHDRGFERIAEFLEGARGVGRISAVGHRVAHGGPDFGEPVVVDANVIQKLERLVPLAPLHQPHNLRPMRVVARRFPGMRQVACFDTAFHAGHSELETAYALPRAISERGVRRYGFHGLSYEYVSRALREAQPAVAAGRVVVAHLGSGASMCAMRDGRSVATTMGFSALSGLPMGTRSGDIDPGVVLYLANHLGMSGPAIERMLYRESGLLGVSGLSADMRALLASADPRAKLAVDLFIHRIGRELGSLAAALGGIDALVFTAGIGERSARIRERVCRDAAWLGVAIDDEANEAGAQRISRSSSAVSVWVVPTDEERVIARNTARLATGVLEAA